MRFSGNAKARGAHGHNPCCDLMFFQKNKSVLRQTEKVEGVEVDTTGLKENLLRIAEVEDQGLILPESSGVYNHNASRTELFTAFRSEIAIDLWREVLT